MTREIKFRGLNANNEWVYGLPRLDLPNKTNYYNEFNYRMTWNENGAECSQPIKNGTLCQYTNLKDKNGVEVYEGDKVKAKFYGKEVVGEIGFNSGCFLLWNSCVSDNQLFIFTDIEVIGNIYEDEVD